MRVRPCGAALFRAAFLLPKSWIWLLAVAALCGRWTLYAARSAARECFRACLCRYPAIFGGNSGYTGDPVDRRSRRDATLIFILIAALYALLCSWTVMRSESLVYLLVLTLPVLALCLIILQTPPAVWAILLVVGVLALLLSDAAAPRTAGRRGEPAGARCFWPRRWRS